LAKFASVSEVIDDPGLYEFAGHSKHVHERQIVIFKGDHGYALVKVERSSQVLSALMPTPRRPFPGKFVRSTIRRPSGNSADYLSSIRAAAC
jgi:hypothetical protein